MSETIEFTIERGSVRGTIEGEPWLVQFFDRSDQQFYGGSGATAWEAIAYALVERVQRRANDQHPVTARTDWDTSMSVLAMVPLAPPMKPREGMKVFEYIAETDPNIKRAIEERIEIVGGAPLDAPSTGGSFALSSVVDKPKSAAARRSKTKKGGSRG